MTDQLITALITAIVAAFADGDGVLTLAAVRKRLEAAGLRVTCVSDAEISEMASAFMKARARKKSMG